MTTNDCKTVPNLITPFWAALPKNYTDEQLAYAYVLIQTDGRFPALAENLPDSEVEKLLQLCETEKTENAEEKKLFLRYSVVLNRLMNRICNACWDKRVPEKLLVCSQCHMTFYCSENCQKTDWTAHTRWCCNRQAVPDEGPMASAVLKRK